MSAARNPRRGPVAPGIAHPRTRARTLLLGILVVLSLFAAQLVRLQGLDAASVSAAAINSRLEVQALPAPRGTITDVGGAELAVSIERKRVVADPTLLDDFGVEDDDEEVHPQDIEAAADAVAETTGKDRGDILEALLEPLGEKYTILAKDVTPQQWQELRRRKVPGVTAETVMRREYPLGEAAAPLIGWMGAGGMPAGGVELIRDEALTGTPGEAVFEVGALGERISTGLYEEDPAVAGQDVRLSIDADLQWYAYDRVRERVKDAGALSGYATVIEVETGRVVALASYPSFDPDDSSQTVEGMRNAAVEDVYEPGSTSKLITAAAALEEGLVEIDTPVEVPVRLYRHGSQFKDAEEHPVEHLTLAGVLAKSSNMGTILFGEQLSDEQLYGWMQKFGLGEWTGIGLPGESQGLLPEPSTWSGTSRYTMMYGQGLSSNLLQQATVFQTVANGGVQVKPSIIAGKTDREGRYHEAKQKPGTRIISEQTAQTLTTIMEQVPAPGGTAPTAAIDGYHVAGKTSTASRVNPRTGSYAGGGVTSSFMGFAPADDPKYVVAVAVQRPTRISEYGGVIAGPVFRDIMRFALQDAGIQPATTPPHEVPLTYDPDDPAPDAGSGVTLGDIAIKDEGTP